MKIFTEKDYVQSQWSGGSTKQLYIYPQDSTYSERNFDLRISIAKVDTDESEFTSLPGFQRKLMILEGEINITHVGHYTKNLNSFEVDEFLGSWSTHSKGKCKDFNVMTSHLFESELFALQLRENQIERMEAGLNSSLYLYVFNGEINVRYKDEDHSIKENSLIELSQVNGGELYIEAKRKSDIIITRIQPSVNL